MSERTICAYGNLIGIMHAYAVQKRLAKEAVPTNFAVWRCHPTQALMILANTPPAYLTITAPCTMDMVRRKVSHFKWMGFEIHEDESAPLDSVFFERDGVTLARIHSLAIPTVPRFDDE